MKINKTLAIVMLLLLSLSAVSVSALNFDHKERNQDLWEQRLMAKEARLQRFHIPHTYLRSYQLENQLNQMIRDGWETYLERTARNKAYVRKANDFVNEVCSNEEYMSWKDSTQVDYSHTKAWKLNYQEICETLKYQGFPTEE